MKDMTIIDIARLAGVSVSTVSRVLNKHSDVSAATKAKIGAIIAEHGYVPNVSARSLKCESTKAIGVVIKGFTNPVFTAMLEIVHQEIERNGYMLLLAQVDPNQDEVDAAIALCKERKPRGLIFMGGNFRHARGKLAMLDAPYVMLTITLDNEVDRAAFSSVTVDDYAAGWSIAEKIYAAGHRKVMIMGASAGDLSISRLREDGFVKGLAAHGLVLGEERIAYSGSFTYKNSYETARALLKRIEFTCLFCVSDIQALGAMRAIHDAGFSVPQDISVIGFDGIEEGQYHIPSLATLRQPVAQMANAGVRALLNHIRSGAPHEHLLFTPEFFAGESFAPRSGAVLEGCYTISG